MRSFVHFHIINIINFIKVLYAFTAYTVCWMYEAYGGVKVVNLTHNEVLSSYYGKATKTHQSAECYHFFL